MVGVEELREEARRLLEEGRVKYVIGYRRGPEGSTAAPFFARKPEDSASLVWDPTCVHNLVRFVRDEKRRRGREKDPDHRPAAIVVKVISRERHTQVIQVLIPAIFFSQSGTLIGRRHFGVA